MSTTPWLSTDEVCSHLSNGRSTLFALKRKGLFRSGHHLVPKNPASSRSHLLWHLQRCELTLGRRS